MDIDVFPNSLEYWGPTGMVFFRNVQVRWMPIQGDTQPDARARAAGRQRRPGRLRRPHRAAGRQGALPAARLLRRVPARAATGATSSSPASLRQHQVGRRRSTTSSTCRATPSGWGINLSSNLKFGESDVAPAAVRLRRRHPELHERRAGRHRHRQNNLGNPRDADRRRSRCRSSASSRSSTTPGTSKFSTRDRLLAGRTTTTPTARRPTRSRRGHYALGNLLYTRCRT